MIHIHMKTRHLHDSGKARNENEILLLQAFLNFITLYVLYVLK